MKSQRQQFVSMALIASLLFVGWVSSVHHHRGTDCDTSDSVVTSHFDCGCKVPHSPADYDHDSDDPCDECEICKLIASHQIHVQTPASLTIVSNACFFQMAEICAIVSQPLRRYLGRAPPVV